MRASGIAFYGLLAAFIALRLFRSSHAPAWYRPLIIAYAAGIILCLTVPPAVDLAQLVAWLEAKLCPRPGAPGADHESTASAAARVPRRGRTAPARPATP